MSETVQLVVDNVIGPRNKRYSFVDTDGQWYGNGFDRPDFSKGDTIQFNFERNGKYLNVVSGSVEVISRSEEAPAPKKATSSNVMTKDDYWSRKEADDQKKQREIRYQASRNAAIEFVRLAVEQGIISLGTKKADQEQNLSNYVEAYTQEFYMSTFAMRDKDELAVDADNLMDTSDIDDLEKFAQ